ncbi:dTDP-4-dehydrorhamnose reductase [Paraglaciecola sp. T6c]|uniref:dTDP-4-dehydrorhamnose reductase n=1 Tax=Pseudoalteromonas atlantica (strain T6c / ATCC BAA-1087) TaxID=3042615 RepID=UPI00005C5162|nr:dTDP-4-dehydrorhamnose reductase [Paraglaciecola sp. T6c]ABG40647.1 dTDP-4-dehydrorhamnose reductase [Paraglaciecola sp. T6c]
MKVLITGKKGQLGWELCNRAPEPTVEVFAFDSAELDITDAKKVAEIFSSIQPNVVINCAAYTAVDKAETDEATAFLVNEEGAKNIANGCKEVGARLLHISTDFVFDGTKCSPYIVSDRPNPLGVYGASKLAGELAIQSMLPEAIIVRTAWVYSSHGNNFVKTMLRLMQEKSQLGIVSDQIGTPTYAAGLADWLWAVVDKPDIKGMYHWTDAGVASWYDFAIAIQELALEKGLLHKAISVQPIYAAQYPTPAKRPAFSVVDKTAAEQDSGVQTVHWRKQLSNMLDNL